MAVKILCLVLLVSGCSTLEGVHYKGHKGLTLREWVVGKACVRLSGQNYGGARGLGFVIEPTKDGECFHSELEDLEEETGCKFEDFNCHIELEEE